MKKILLLLLIPVWFVTACDKKKDSGPAAPTVTTFAGSGIPGSANGMGAAASFFHPLGVATDVAGNIYVADAGNNLIRKISPAGIVTTIAGSGAQGSVNGTGTSASFWAPNNVAVGATGNIYVADTGNNLIRKISSAGVVSTLAGSGTVGSTNGTGTAASFNYPVGIAVDAADNVYVADHNNNLVREITPEGAVTTLAGSGATGSVNGTGTAASFNNPVGVAADAAGNVYVADESNSMIRIISPGGVVTTLAGNGTQGFVNGIGTSASFAGPYGIAVDVSGNVYVTDNNTIRKISKEGIVTTFAGSGTWGSANGTGTSASFAGPTSVTADAAGNIYVADWYNNLIRKISL